MKEGPAPTDVAASRTLTWHRLVRAAAIADLVIIAVAAAIPLDRSALALSGLFLVALAFLRIRRGVAGRVMLGVLTVDTLAFMLPATASNIAHRDDAFDILVPASLTVISIAGAIAAVAGTFRTVPDGDRAAPIVAQCAVGIFVVAIIASLVAGRGEAEQAARPNDLVVRIAGNAFADRDLSAAAGEVAVAAVNRDLFWHTFTLPALGVDLGVPIGAQRRATFRAGPGRYRFVCRVPGHEAAGMHGTLTLT